MTNTEIDNLDDFRAQIKERKQRYDALRKKRNDVMQERVDEVNGV
jgi:hypothetical protein